MVFHGSMSCFHDSRWIFMVINVSRLGFHDLRWIFMVINGSRLIVTIFHGSRLVYI